MLHIYIYGNVHQVGQNQLTALMQAKQGLPYIVDEVLKIQSLAHKPVRYGLVCAVTNASLRRGTR